MQSSGAWVAKPSFVYVKFNTAVKSSIVSSLVPVQQMHMFPVCQTPGSLWCFFQFGIKSLKRGSVRNHQDFSQKTLIALVTSGLMLAFLGLAGYFLMKRRSWSPAGERLVSAYRWQNSR